MTELSKIPFILGFLLMLAIGFCRCSNNDYNPEDYYQSLLSGEYGKGKLWNLNVILNGDTIQSDGYVRFDCKYQAEDADFRFANVIPGESYKEFKKIPLFPADNGLAFTIDYSHKTEDIHISGTVTLGEMTVKMTISE